MHNFTMSDTESRLFEMGGGLIAILDGALHLGDLMDLKPGGIVRCRQRPQDCIKVFYGPEEPVGCVAGWISEDE